MHNVAYDIYQCGVVMYIMCNGYDNFNYQLNMAQSSNGVHDNQKLLDHILNGQFPNRDYFLPHISLQLKRIVKKALSVDPNDRYSTVIDILNDLSALETFNEWRYSKESGGKEQWVNGSRVVNVINNTKECDIFVSKNNRRVNDFIKSNLPISKKQSVLFKCLNNDW